MFFKRGDSKVNKIDLRINVVFFLVFFLFAVLVLRFYFLQVVNYDRFFKTAEEQRSFSSVIPAERGGIFLLDKLNEVNRLATKKSIYEVYAIPKEIKDKEDFLSKVLSVIDVDEDLLRTRIFKENDPYEPIKSIISEEEKIKLESFLLDGIGFKERSQRYYPNQTLASHISGFLSKKNEKGVGQYGIEEYYNRDLSGVDGFLTGERDSFRSNIISKGPDSFPAINGSDVYLSIDPNVQFKIEDEIKNLVDKWSADSASVIVMEPKTGRILGMANYPNFNPNEYRFEKNISVFSNKSVSSQYEPGSIFKPITMAIGIDSGVIEPDTVYEDKGFLSISGYTIRNYDGKANGKKTMTEVLEKSLNTGTVFVVDRMPKDKYFEYVKNFGFGEKTGIDLPAEARGDIRNLKSNRDINFATSSFGQGIATTPIQMISAISALANDGVLLRPSVVDFILNSDGSRVDFKKKEIRRVVSKETSDKVKKMLVSVVENGFDKAKINGYFVAGKTGTAQVASSDGRGYSDEVIHSFVGFAPAYNPSFTLLIKLEKPKDVKYASQSLTVPFRDIMRYLLSYYDIPPDYSTK